MRPRPSAPQGGHASAGGRCRPISAARRLSRQLRRSSTGWRKAGARTRLPMSSPYAHRAMGRASRLAEGAERPRPPAVKRRFEVAGGGGGARRERAERERVWRRCGRHGAAEEMAGAPRGHLPPAALQDGRLPGRHAAHGPGERREWGGFGPVSLGREGSVAVSIA